MNDSIQHDVILFRQTLPFTPSDKQVLYIEDKYDDAINAFIRAHYDDLRAFCLQVGYDFCYLPLLSERLSQADYISYFTPYRSSVAQDVSFLSDYLNDYAKRGSDLRPAFICYSETRSNSRYYAFRALRLEVAGADLMHLAENYLSDLEEERRKYWDGLRFCNTTDASLYETDEYADEHFPDEVRRLMEDVRSKIDRLRQSGVNEMALRALLCPTVQLSRLRITPSYAILLPDYGNREIKMTPLVKAVFLLFLRHPEGIVFKALSDYRAELLRIYSRLTGRLSNEQVYQSIMDVTDPCKNSINEKCARIREAFVREFDDRLAQYYYVTGERGTAKKISLPRHLVVWETR